MNSLFSFLLLVRYFSLILLVYLRALYAFNDISITIKKEEESSGVTHCVEMLHLQSLKQFNVKIT